MKRRVRKRMRLVFLYGITIALTFFYGVSSSYGKDWVYEVRKGDSLWGISINYLIDSSYAKKVQEINSINDPWHLKPGTTIRIPGEWVRRFPSLLQVKNLQGTAQILDDGGNQPRQLLKGSIVMQGDIVVTDAESTLVLVFLDGSSVLLQENSRLKINHLTILENTGMSDSQLQLEAGRMETQVTPNKNELRQFQIETPASVTSVRGTNYRVSAEPIENESRTEVVEGKVDVKGVVKMRSLTTGFGTVTIKNQDPLPPIKLLPKPDVSRVPSVFDQVPINFSMPTLNVGHGYRVQIAKTSLFKDILFNKLAHSATIRCPDFPDGEYYVRIREVDAQQLEGLNAQKKIRVNARPDPPFLVTPNEGKGVLIEEDMAFKWSKQQRYTQYHFQIATDPNFSDLLVDKLGVDSSELAVDETMEAGKYFWRVATVDQNGDGPFSEGQMFRRIKPAPDLNDPEVTEELLIVRSRRGLLGQTYHFQVSKDESFSEVLADRHTNEPKIEVPNPGGGTYYIRVGTIDSDGFVGPLSNPQQISIPYDLSWLLSLLPLLVLIAL